MSINSNLSSFSNYNTNDPTTSLEDIDKFENEIFKRITASHRRFIVKIDKGRNEIWTLSVNPQLNNIPILLIHGYLAGIGVWLKNIDALSESRPLYAIDLLGFGRSSRSDFNSDPIEAENQFVDSIEEWRKEMKLNQIIILGHSFGGYIATLYTIKYPNNIEKLILDDPWGFADPSISPPTNRFAVIRSLLNSLIRRSKKKFIREKNIQKLSDFELIYKYFLSINSILPSSGKDAAKNIAVKYSFSKNPLINRIDKMDPNIPIWFIFGGRSWINYQDGFRVMDLRPKSSKTIVKVFG